MLKSRERESEKERLEFRCKFDKMKKIRAHGSELDIPPIYKHYPCVETLSCSILINFQKRKKILKSELDF